MGPMTDKFGKATGRDIHEWMGFMQAHEAGAADLNQLSHQQLAVLAVEGGASAWWGQSIAVEIERMIGRREVGQTATGSVNAGASKTVRGEWTEVFNRFVSFMAEGGERLPVGISEGPRISETDKWRYWRATLADGSSLTIDCADASRRGVAKARLSVQQDQLPSMEDRDEAKVHWRGVLTEFADL